MQQMYKREDTPPPLICVRRDDSSHLPSPRHRRHSNDLLHGNDRLQGNDMPITSNLDDMIDALDHDISRITVHSKSSEDTLAASLDGDSLNSALLFQLFN